MKLIFEKRGRGTRFPNLYYDCGDHIKIKMWNCEKEYFIEIDKDDIEIAKQCNWKIREDSKTVYALNSKMGFLHRLINKTENGLETDHIDGNGLNNRRNNLRTVDSKTNGRNRRNVEGVFFEDGEHPRWRALWVEDGQQKTKSFSVKTYGADAEKMARDYRKKIEQDIYKRPAIT